MSREDLIERAKERAEPSPIPDSWGARVTLAENDAFVGRWRGEAVDEAHEDRRIFLLWNEDGEPCFSRHYAALGREIDRAAPSIGCTIVIYRSADYVGRQGTGYSFGVETEPNDSPLPGDAADVDEVLF